MRTIDADQLMEVLGGELKLMEGLYRERKEQGQHGEADSARAKYLAYMEVAQYVNAHAKEGDD